MSVTIKNMIEDTCTDHTSDTIVPLPNFHSKILTMVIQYCKKHVHEMEITMDDTDAGMVADDLNGWDDEFMMDDLDTLFHIIYVSSWKLSICNVFFFSM